MIRFCLFFLILPFFSLFADFWGEIQQVASVDSSDIGAVALATNDEGDAMAVWAVNGEAVYSAYKAFGDTTWGSAIEIEALGGGEIVNWLNIALADSGDAAVAWFVGTNPTAASTIHVSYFTAGSSSWPTPTTFDAVLAPPGPKVVMDSNGIPIVLWLESGSSTPPVKTATYLGGSWMAGSSIGSAISGGYVSNLAGTPDGDLVALWAVGPGNFTFSSRIDNVWSSPTNVFVSGNPVLSTASGTSISGSSDGFFLGIAQGSDSPYAIKSFVATSPTTTDSWTTTTLDSVDNAITARSRFGVASALTDDGNGLLVWRNTDGIAASFYSPDIGYWLPNTQIYNGDTTQVACVITPAMTGVALINSSETPPSILYTIKSSQGSWAATDSLSTSTATTVNFPNVATSSVGKTYAVWFEGDGTSFQIASRERSALSAPSNFSGKIQTNRFPTQSNISHYLTWGRPPGNAHDSYRIFSDPSLENMIAIIPYPGVLDYTFNNRDPYSSYTYYLVAYSQDESLESVPAVVAVPAYR